MKNQRTQATETQAYKVSSILKKYCYDCHGADGVTRGGISNILDLKRLVDIGVVIPEQAERSTLFKLVHEKQMPPDQDLNGQPIKDNARPSNEEINEIYKWIQTGAKNENQVRFSTLAEDYNCAESDLKKMQQEEPTSATFVRYFWLGPALSSGASNDLQNSFSILINSLSSKNPTIIKPLDICGTGRVYRIDIRDYGWDKNIGFRKLESTNPYRFSSLRNEGSNLLLRADWFAYEASRPPFYHDLLNLPQSLKEVEQGVGINTNLNTLSQQHLNNSPLKNTVMRVGFHGYPEDSKVAFNNRMLERHEIPNGSFWLSYEFDTNEEEKNLFLHPLGPRGSNAFKHAGGEIIWNLPNQLQAYMLVNAEGKRLDSAPANLVWDHVKNQPVLNGISCMSCHEAGMKSAKQKVRPFWEQNPHNFQPYLRDQVLRLYPPQEKINDAIFDDSKRFQEAVKSAKVVSEGKNNPLTTLSENYEQQVTLQRAALELGLEEETLLQIEATLSARGRQTFTKLKTVGLSRKEFEKFFLFLDSSIVRSQIHNTQP